MIHDYINPSSEPMDPTDATAMTHRTASQSFEQRRHIEKNRSIVGSYESAAKKAQIEAHQTILDASQSARPKAAYYSEMRESMGIRSEDTQRNPYNADRQTGMSTGSRDRMQSFNAKTGGLAIPKRSKVEPKFREPPTRSFNPYE